MAASPSPRRKPPAKKAAAKKAPAGRVTPKKATRPAMAATLPSRTVEESAGFDFDAFEREARDQRAREGVTPFMVRISPDRAVEFPHPADLDYRDLLKLAEIAAGGNVEDMLEAMDLLVPTEHRDEFFDRRVPAGAMGEMLIRYFNHFGIGVEPGEADASSPS